MLATVDERPMPRVLPLEPDPDSHREREAESMPGWPWPAGFPAPADDVVERRLSLDAHLIRHPASTFLVRVNGDDWADEGLHDGDLLVVDRAAPPSTGSLVMAVVDGTVALRRVGRDAEGRRVLQSAHPDAPDRALDAGADTTRWGVARWVIHRLWPGRRSS